ncbi:MAG: hypothetical protein WCQ57_15655 [Verrucomicrobiota bacterium]
MKKNRSGQILVLTILLVAALAAWGTRLHYNARHPVSVQARLLGQDRVLAEFAPDARKIIRKGMRATISLQGGKYTGTIGEDTLTEHPGSFLLTIAPPPTGLATGTPGKVIVDTTVPPELLKDGKRAN